MRARSSVGRRGKGWNVVVAIRLPLDKYLMVWVASREKDVVYDLLMTFATVISGNDVCY